MMPYGDEHEDRNITSGRHAKALKNEFRGDIADLHHAGAGGLQLPAVHLPAVQLSQRIGKIGRFQVDDFQAADTLHRLFTPAKRWTGDCSTRRSHPPILDLSPPSGIYPSIQLPAPAGRILFAFSRCPP